MVLKRPLHLLTGLAFLALFLASGAYMRFREPPVAELEPGLRMLFRSRHIYLLFTALLNLGAAGLRAPVEGWQRRVATVGSWFLLVAPWLAAAAFWLEAVALAAPSPVSISAVQSAFAGVLLLALATRGRRPPGGGPAVNG